jgi:hypothetical protein
MIDIGHRTRTSDDFRTSNAAIPSPHPSQTPHDSSSFRGAGLGRPGRQQDPYNTATISAGHRIAVISPRRCTCSCTLPGTADDDANGNFRYVDAFARTTSQRWISIIKSRREKIEHAFTLDAFAWMGQRLVPQNADRFS